MVKRQLSGGVIALVAIGLLVPMMVMMFTLGMVGGSNMNMRSLSVMAGRINARMRMGKRIPHREERNNQDGKQSIQVKTSRGSSIQVYPAPRIAQRELYQPCPLSIRAQTWRLAD